MRRIQLYIEPDIDDALSAVAARRGVSRSALVREAVRLALRGDGGVLAPDPLDALVGSIDVAPDDDLDAVIYDTES
ncbi:CopG family transcriptional regulator [Candidatus Poriferisodalis sp.]|uniref:ribbon-helix-helix domain-containing protein n=1 Tax=Candidatus Poriferisodalis sp. TaxID=3101277 RepID=UPI003C704151